MNIEMKPESYGVTRKVELKSKVPNKRAACTACAVDFLYLVWIWEVASAGRQNQQCSPGQTPDVCGGMHPRILHTNNGITAPTI